MGRPSWRMERSIGGIERWMRRMDSSIGGIERWMYGMEISIAGIERFIRGMKRWMRRMNSSIGGIERWMYGMEISIAGIERSMRRIERWRRNFMVRDAHPARLYISRFGKIYGNHSITCYASQKPPRLILARCQKELTYRVDSVRNLASRYPARKISKKSAQLNRTNGYAHKHPGRILSGLH
jgi:hypothetical protein